MDNPSKNEKLEFKHEPGNSGDPYTVAVMKETTEDVVLVVVGHVPRSICSIFKTGWIYNLLRFWTFSIDLFSQHYKVHTTTFVRSWSVVCFSGCLLQGNQINTYNLYNHMLKFSSSSILKV